MTGAVKEFLTVKSAIVALIITRSQSNSVLLSSFIFDLLFDVFYLRKLFLSGYFLSEVVFTSEWRHTHASCC